MLSRRKVAVAIRSLFNIWGFQLEYARVLYRGLLFPVLLYNSKADREGKISRIRDVQVKNLRGVFGIRKMDRILNA